MVKRKQTLEEGLEKSASKKNLRGKSKQRYIGGAIRNMEKKGQLQIKRKAASPKQKTMFGVKPPPKPKKAKPKAKPKPKPEPVRALTPVRVPKGQQIKLTAKTNEAASLRLGYKVYSVYYAGKGGKQFSTSTHRTLEGAKKEAGLAMDAHNHPKGVHTQSSFGLRQRQYLA